MHDLTLISTPCGVY